MPIIRASEATTYEVHGSTFHSYVAPSRQPTDVCTWQVEVPPNLRGATHRPSRDEVLRVLSGQLVVSTDGESGSLDSGDVVFIRSRERPQARWRPRRGNGMGVHHSRA